MLSFTLTMAARAEILKADVGVVDAAAGRSSVRAHLDRDNRAPVVVVVVAPDRSAQVLATWKAWLLGHSRSIALILLMVIGVFLVVRGVYDLAA